MCASVFLTAPGSLPLCLFSAVPLPGMPPPPPSWLRVGPSKCVFTCRPLVETTPTLWVLLAPHTYVSGPPLAWLYFSLSCGSDYLLTDHISDRVCLLSLSCKLPRAGIFPTHSFLGLKYPQHGLGGSQSIFCHYKTLQTHLLFSLPQPCLQPFILLWANDVRMKIWVQLPLGVIASSSSQGTTRQHMYRQFSLFLVDIFYEAAVNIE